MNLPSDRRLRCLGHGDRISGSLDGSWARTGYAFQTRSRIYHDDSHPLFLARRASHSSGPTRSTHRRPTSCRPRTSSPSSMPRRRRWRSRARRATPCCWSTSGPIPRSRCWPSRCCGWRACGSTRESAARNGSSSITGLTIQPLDGSPARRIVLPDGALDPVAELVA